MSIFPQMLLDIHDEMIVELFAGGGGGGCGIEMATGRQVDVAVNHDPQAIAMHQANHPQTHHRTCDVFEVDPRSVTAGRPIGLLWASPDCTYHSKARGSKPIRSKNRKRRALAWVVTRWAAQVRPRVIMLENVEEFAQWGPLIGPPDNLRPCPRRRGTTFRKWVRSLTSRGYQVEWRELRACDYGAPTIRKRLFVIARCDGKPIVWPAPTHGPGTRKPYRTAAECIDWSIPMLSIFATREEAKAWGKLHGVPAPKRPLVEATMRRLARGTMRYVVEAAEPFVVSLAHGYSGGRREYSIDEPIGTQHSGGNKFAIAAPYLVPRYGERAGQEPRTRSVEEPVPAIVPTGNGAQLVAAFLAQHNGGMVGHDAREPVSTIVQKGSTQALVAAHIQRDFGTSTGHPADSPLATITADGGGKAALVYSFLQKYYGTDQDPHLREPLHTVTTKDRFGVVTVMVRGEPFYIADIAMRMFQPRELYNAQGFPPDYVITVQVWDPRRKRLRWLTKTEQVMMVGNSVSPPLAAALARANVPEMIARDEVAA